MQIADSVEQFPLFWQRPSTQGCAAEVLIEQSIPKMTSSEEIDKNL